MRRISCLVLLFFTSAAYATVRIIAPPFDSVTNVRTVTIAGTADVGDGTTIKVIAAAVTYTANVTAGTWKVNGVRLANGFNKVRAQSPKSGSNTFVAISFDTLVNRGQQRGHIVWGNGTDDMLKQIAKDTLTPAPSAADLDTFAKQVKVRVSDVVHRAYDGIANVRFVDAPGNNVQEILIDTSFKSGEYGISPADCGNPIAKHSDPSHIHLGTYAAAWKNLSRWRPMQKSDTLEMRIIDVAEAVGRTAAHEFGHSFGMCVCGWMAGCEGGHNCPSFDVNNPPVDRFNNGFFIMDGGLSTFNWARIAEPVSSKRTTPRTPAVFNFRNRSYLAVIHPLP